MNCQASHLFFLDLTESIKILYLLEEWVSCDPCISRSLPNDFLLNLLMSMVLNINEIEELSDGLFCCLWILAAIAVKVANNKLLILRILLKT